MAAAKKARRALRRKQSRELESAPSDQLGSGAYGKSIEGYLSSHFESSIKALGTLLQRHWSGTLTLGLLAAISYFPALNAGFVWDDLIFMVDEPAIQQWSGISQIWLSPTDLDEQHYWPVVYSSFWLEHKLWGMEPTGYHAVNIFLHFVNCLLIWLLMLRLQVTGAWAIAAVFAVHPVHVESVAWVIARKDLLSALFYLAAVLAWMRFAILPSRRWSYCGALILFALALLSKSIAVTLPVALLIWHAWKRSPVTRPDIRRLVPFFAVAIVITALDLSFYLNREPLALGYSLIERATIVARALFFYAGKLLWPADLAVIYPHWQVDASEPVAWVFLVSAVALPTVLWALRQRIGAGPLVGAAFFAVTLAPVLGLLDYGYMQFSFVADRYQYLASCGVLAVLVASAAKAAGRLKGGFRMAVYAGGAVVVAMLAVKTWHHAGVFSDGITLFRHIISLNPNARDAHLNLSDALVLEGRFEEGLAESRVAVKQRPDHANTHWALGRALTGLKRYDQAEEALRRARALTPGNAGIALNLAATMLESGRLEEAAELFREALDGKTDHAAAHVGMGRTLVKLGRHQEGREHLRRAADMRPDDPTMLLEEGEALRIGGFPERALPVYQQLLARSPASAGAHAGTGLALLELERYPEAIQELEEALALDPEMPIAGALHRHLGTAYVELGNFEEAAENFRRAIESDPDDADAMDRLGLLFFERGNFRDALGQYLAMVDLRPNSAQVHVNIGLSLVNLGRDEEALPVFERAQALDPDFTGLHETLRLLRLKVGRDQDR